MKHPRLRRLATLSVLVAQAPLPGAGDRVSERHSYSLSTFDPSGRLGQVERAHVAAALGPPVLVAVVASHPVRAVVMVAPQSLPSLALMEDDGTSRFLHLTPEIAVAHTGLSADGRFVLSKARRLAIEHEYAFDEPIPVTVLLEELSLLYQQYTMKPAARPLGVYVLVAHLPRDVRARPTLFRLDPSGNVQTIQDDVVVLNGNLERTQLRRKAEEVLLRSATSSDADIVEGLVTALQEALHEQASKRRDEPSEVDMEAQTVIAATLSAQRYKVRRFD